MPFKYAAELAALQDCPPQTCQPQEITAFRTVFSDPPTAKCFAPLAKRSPARVNDMTGSARCSAQGLSFFISLDALRQRMRHLKRTAKNLEKSVGNKIARGVLNEDDGLCDGASDLGHFTFHEFEGAQLWTKCHVVAAAIV